MGTTKPVGKYEISSKSWWKWFFSRRILSKWARPLQWQVLFFFVRPQNVCVMDTFYRTTKSTEPASGITSELLQRVPSFVYSVFNVRYKTGRDYRVPFLSIFRHCATFFSNLFLSPNGPPSGFILQQTEVSKSPKCPLSSFSALWDFQNSHFLFFLNFFSKNFLILSPNGFPFKFFDLLQQTEDSKSPKGPPF